MEASPLGEVSRAIIARRSMTKATDQPVARHAVELLLAAAVAAPNHRRTEPWRFVVMTGTARDDLGRVMAEALERRGAATGELPSEEQLLKERAKPLRAPVVIAVFAVASSDPKTIEIEEVEATAAAVENIMLAAPDLGLAAMWRTGDAAYDPAVKQHLGYSSHDHLVAFLYIGYPEIIPPLVSHDAEGCTTWRGWYGEEE